MKNKQLLIEWGWENYDGFELLPSINITKHEVGIKWLFFFLIFFHPVNNIFDK